MEVHAHSHTTRKKWTHYLWEFLMLFLAVFCGFLAEYKLEQTIERHREKEYMVSLYQDLKNDTASISSLINGKTQDLANSDSFFAIFSSKKYLQETSGAYYFGRKLLNLKSFYPNDGTITQLVNAGGLRLIRNRATVDSIQSYKHALSQIKNFEELEREHLANAKNFIGKIFDANVFDIMIDNSVNGVLQRPDKNYPLMPFTAGELNDFHVPMNFNKRNKISQIALLKVLQKKATNLMKLLKDKYKVNQE